MLNNVCEKVLIRRFEKALINASLFISLGIRAGEEISIFHKTIQTMRLTVVADAFKF